MLNQRSRSLSWLLALSLIAVACGDDDDDTSGSGGTAGKGGSTSTGGKASNGGSTTTGGTSAKGGATSTGGTSTTGGKASTGGVSAGGMTPTGGTDAGGASGEGGMPEGGTTTGTGGAPEGGMAGASTGGTAGMDAGGAGGMGGSDTVGGGAGGEGGEAPVQITIVNGDFDTPVWADPPSGWTETGDGAAASTSESPTPHSGLRYYNLWLATAYELTWSQVVAVPNGTYSLAVWHEGGPYTEQYLFARGYDSGNNTALMKTNTSENAGWTQVVVSSIPVTSGQIEIGVYSNAAAGNWSHFDDVTLTKLP